MLSYMTMDETRELLIEYSTKSPETCSCCRFSAPVVDSKLKLMKLWCLLHGDGSYWSTSKGCDCTVFLKKMLEIL